MNEPSVIAMDERNGDMVALGLEAKRMLGKTHPHLVAIRPIRDGVITCPDQASLLLRGVMEQASRKRFLRARRRVVIGIPSGIKEIELRAIRSSAYAAGAREALLVHEPMAAAIGCGLPIEAPRGSMVIDIGGGSAEIAVISLSGLVTNRSIRTAGDEIDEAIITAVQRDLNLFIGHHTAERVKFSVGSVLPLEEELSLEISGRHVVSGLPSTVEITSEHVRDWIEEPIAKILRAVKSALEETPPELSADIQTHGVTLTGGGALIRRLDDRIEQMTGIPVHVDEDPLTCVARGTARILEDPRAFAAVVMD